MIAARPIKRELTPEQEAERGRQEQLHQERLRRQEYERLHAVELTIAQLKKDAEEKLGEAERLSALLTAFPDLLKRVGRWEKVAYYSKAANVGVTDFDSRHNCGCCEDSPLEIWPYLETAHGKVYSDPPCFTVGERCYESGYRPYAGWDSKMREAGIPEPVIEMVGRILQAEDEDEYESEESDGAEE